ncbi:DUF4150 domain-containing protein [Nannocystis pusilla]|uniref:DUF4150 domain-containing protein n=1 Tax=Nannocystis pusilla TaxID=889268 RepID=A0ABS7TME2_9BACT|nr:DUF4150 domain-containing protein [Nannocystis pusilla]MBZ5709307.1 DUF4150 domain-containing protein [Nannocystis pusilla]
MGKKVYANGMEIAHKAGDAKVMAAFPDVCLSPPPPPTGPIPVPYPDSSFARDLKQGSRAVVIGGKPLALRGQSFYTSKPLGDEAATRNFGGSVLTHTISGKTYFQAHSMDVLVEGKNVCRHLDLTTSNHASYPGGTPPIPNMSEMHRLALDRIAAKQCPCCGSRDCAAAFKEGEEPLSMREALRIDPKAPNYSPKRAEEYKLLRSVKKTECTCDGKTFPSPPCDVFRKPDPVRHTDIERQWDKARDKYKEWYKETYDVELHGMRHFMQKMLAVYPQATQAAMARTTTLSRQQRAGNKLAQQRDRIEADARKLERINHLTPKEYGGCPTNPDNLQPQQRLCLACQEIDQFMTDTW